MIQISRLRKLYRLGTTVLTAIDEISLSVEEGQFVSIVGPSGCGKSTLLNIVGGLVRKTSGEVKLQGREVTRPSREIGMMFQSPVLLPWRTNLDNVLLPIEVFGLDRRAYREKARELLEKVGLGDFAHTYPFQLSGGMQQRVAICRMLLYDPLVLLMDEPFGALDELSREFMNLELLRIWEEQRKTVLFVTHSISEAVFLSDLVVVLTPRPARVCELVPTKLPRPRMRHTLSTPEFFDHVAYIRSILG